MNPFLSCVNLMLVKLENVELQSACLNVTLFSFSKDARSFNDAQADCAAQNGNLARISTNEESDFVKNLLNQVNERGTKVWIGVNEEVGSVSPLNYEFVDGIVDGTEFFKVEKRNFPWEPLAFEPNNENERCVLLVDGLSLWGDENCDKEERYLCRIESSNVCLGIIINENDNDNIKDDNSLNFLFLSGALFTFVLLIITVFVLYKRVAFLNSFNYSF